jgi:hypothetical protein
MRTLKLFLLVLFLSANYCFAQTAREIVIKSGDVVNLESVEMTATLKISDGKGNSRIRKVTSTTKKFGDVLKNKIRFESPADVAGTTILIYDYKDKDDDIWIYLPSMKKTRRIISTEKGNSFMGSEFSNADMSKPNPDDYDYKLLADESIDGKLCWCVEAVCKNKSIASSNGFSKKISYISKNNFLPIKFTYFDSNGQVFKEMVFSDYKKTGETGFFAYSMIAKNLKTGRFSEMKVEKFNTGTNLKESAFSTNSFFE